MAREKFTHSSRWQAVMEAAGFDAVILASPNAIFYATGALLPAQLNSSVNLAARLMDDRPAFAVICSDGTGTLLVSDRDAPSVQRDTWIEQIEIYREGSSSPVERLAETIRRMGLATGRLGVEFRYLTVNQMDDLSSRTPGAFFEGCDDQLTSIRAVKTPAEIAVLRTAGEATAEAIWRGFQASCEGDTEKLVADQICAELIELGADHIYLGVLGAGEHSLHAHNIPGDRKLRAGDIVRADYGGKFDGFASDLARMGVVGAPSAEHADVYRKCRGIQLETIASMRAGREAREIYAYCSELFAREGLTLKLSHTGHAFALGGHDYPMLHPSDTTVLETDMIMCVEPVLVDSRLGMIQIEDLVRVTPSGGELLTGARNNDSMWVIPA